MAESFDDFYATETQFRESELKEFQFRDNKDEEGTHQWLKDNFYANEKQSHSRKITYRRNQALYKNIHYSSYDSRESDRDRDIEFSDRRPRHSVNFVFEMVERRVAQMARLGVNIALIPHNDEQSDKNNARSCKLMLDNRAEELDLKDRLEKGDRVENLLGASLYYIPWDEELGPLHPTYRKLLDQHNGDIPKDIKKKLKKEGDIRIGDVDVKCYGPDRFYVEPFKRCWEEVNYFEIIDFMSPEEIKARWPNKADQISEDTEFVGFYDLDSSEMIKPRNKTPVMCFYHKPTKFFPEGCRIKYTHDCILEWIDFPYDDGELPAVYGTDVDIYSEFWGRSFIYNIEQMQRFYNNVQAAQARDFSLLNAPKWIVQKGTVNVHSLNNDVTVVEVKGGAFEPKVVTHKPTNSQGMEMQDRLEEKISRHSFVNDISRGQVPTGVTANSALRFLDEQESQSIEVRVNKRKKKVLKIYRMMLSRMRQYYKAGDGRMVRILGKNNEYMIRSFKEANFSRIYDIRIQNTSSLPDTKTGKIAAIIDLNAATQTDPIFRKEEVVELLEMGNDEAFKSKATVSLTAANTCLEMILEGEKVEPQMWWDFLVTYAVFDKHIQTVGFNKYTDPRIQALVGEFMTTLEGLMFERAKVNFPFAQQLATLDNYPMFFKPEMPVTKLIAFHQQDIAGGIPNPDLGRGVAATDTGEIEEIAQQNADESQGE